MKNKYCKYCDTEKPEDCFRLKKDKPRKDGTVNYYRVNICNECSYDKYKLYKEKNIEKVRESRRKYDENNKEKKANCDKRYREKNKERIKDRSKELLKNPKYTKTCKNCGVKYQSKNPLSYLCSIKCFGEYNKTARKGKNNPAYRTGDYSDKKNNQKLYYKQKEFEKNRKEIAKEMIDKHGYLFCEKCGTSNTLQWETHHIVYRSEKPKHKYLHNKRNLIHLCIQCHNNAHKNKHEWRKELIEKRNLTELFGNDILPIKKII